MADRELIAVVVLDGVVYGPGWKNPPPDDVAARILNPSVWPSADSDSPVDEEPVEVDDEDEPDAPEHETTEPTEPEPAPSGPTPAPTPVKEEVDAPPRSGKGSGFPVWKAFADAHGVSSPAGATREDIIDACEAVGLV